MAEYTRIDFLKYRYAAALFSCALVVAGIAGYMYRGGFVYSVDFSGGTQVLYKFSKPVGSEHLKTTLVKQGWGDAVIRELGNSDVAIRVKDFTTDVAGLAQKMKDGLQAEFPDTVITIEEANAVGPAAGKMLFLNSLIALMLGLLLMLLYIAWRFWSFSFGVGAMVAIFHDAVAILTVFACFGLEISPNVICAILAMLSYSINDTIIIYSRIRENMAKEKGKNIEVIVNESINQTLRRTLMTSFATTLAAGALFVFGGEALHTLSLSFLIGIVIGTYSSIYVASPVMLALRRRI
jgi:preprotein translocase subunit SecF